MLTKMGKRQKHIDKIKKEGLLPLEYLDDYIDDLDVLEKESENAKEDLNNMVSNLSKDETIYLQGAL